MKYFWYAIGEIILVVLGILIALQINNRNTERTNQQDIRVLAKSLVKELELDIDEIETRVIQINKINRRIDSLIQVINASNTYNALNIDLLCLSWNLYYMPYKWNRSTLDQLKSSAALKHVKNDSILKKIGKYDAFTRHLEEDYKGDQSRIEKLEPFVQQIVNYNYSNISSITTDLFFKISDPKYDDFEFFDHLDYVKAREENLQVLSRNQDDYNQLINKLVSLQFQYGVRDHELNNLKEEAKLIIHPLGSRHMIDPSKLQAGATAVYGEQAFKESFDTFLSIFKSF